MKEAGGEKKKKEKNILINATDGLWKKSSKKHLWYETDIKPI